MKTYILTLSLLLSSGWSAHALEYSVSSSCEDNETWSLAGNAKGTLPKWIGQFQDFAASRVSPVYGFSQAIQLKRMSAIMVKADFERDFSEYWVGRILFRLNLDPVAHQVFRSVYENAENPMVRKAAFACMAQIQKRTPDWKIAAGPEWTKLPFNDSDAEVIFIASQGKVNALTKTLPLAYQHFLSGMNAISSKNFSAAIESFNQFLTETSAPSKSILSRYADDAHLFLGRAYYSVAKFKDASEQFQKVKKTSNFQTDALSDLAWSYLLSEDYDAAIGITLQLRTGAIRNAFTPEPMMVSAMALNELCLYPDSIRMMQFFVHDYASSFEWLDQHQNAGDLYSEVLKIMKRQPGLLSTVPPKVASEWLKTPAFLSRQLELNQLIEHPKRLADVQKKAAFEQGALTMQFMETAQKFIKDVKLAKLKMKPGEELNAGFGERYLKLRRELRNLTRYYKASKIWKNLARNYEKKIPGHRAELVAHINRDLKSKNAQMLTTLNKVRENMDLIEVEMYNGASQDLIWKNAHPDYEKVSAHLKDEKEEEDAARVWKWGRMLASEADTVEVWEDEIGALKADISNMCSKKDRYLKLRVKNKE